MVSLGLSKGPSLLRRLIKESCITFLRANNSRLNYANSFNQKLSDLKKEYHHNCIFNGLHHLMGKDLEIDFKDDGTLIAEFFCHERYQGFDGMLHGGIMAALLDAAMTQCLMGHEVVAYTARLNVKYIKPIQLGQYINIHCGIERVRYGKLYELSAQIAQDSRICASVQASFYRIK